MRKSFLWIAALILVAGTVGIWAQSQTQGQSQSSTQQSSSNQDIYTMLKDDHQKIMSDFDRIVPSNWEKQSSSTQSQSQTGQTGDMSQTGQTGQTGQTSTSQSTSSMQTQNSQDFQQLKNLLNAHMRGEEQYFYPVLQQNPDSSRDAEVSIEEHWIAKRVLNQLSGTSSSSEMESEKSETQMGQTGKTEEQRRQEQQQQEQQQGQTGQTGQTGKEQAKESRESQYGMTGQGMTADRWMARCFVLRNLVQNHIKNEEGPVFSAAKKVIPKDQSVQIAQQYSQLRSTIVTG